MIISRSSGRTYIIWDGGNLSPITFGICVKLMPIRSDSNQRGILSHGHLLLRSPWLSPRRILVPCTLNLKMVRRARNHFFWWQIICIDISKGWCCKDFQLTMKGHLKVSAVFLGNSFLKASIKDSLEIFFLIHTTTLLLNSWGSSKVQWAVLATKSSYDPVVVMKFEFCTHSARLRRKLYHVLLWILSTNTGLWQCSLCAE